METEDVYFKGHQIKIVWPPMKENRLQWMSVHKGVDHHPCCSCPSLWKPFSREFRTVPIRCQEEIFCSFMFQFLLALHVEHSKASAGVRFFWLCVFFVLGSTYKGLLAPTPPPPPLFSNLTIFLFGILLNLERPFEALMFKFWQQVVCHSVKCCFPLRHFSYESRTQTLPFRNSP